MYVKLITHQLLANLVLTQMAVFTENFHSEIKNIQAKTRYIITDTGIEGDNDTSLSAVLPGQQICPKWKSVLYVDKHRDV